MRVSGLPTANYRKCALKHQTYTSSPEKEELHCSLRRLSAAMAAAGGAAGIPASVADMVKALAVQLEDHLRYEEDHVQPVGRKHVPLEMAKQAVRKVRAVSEVVGLESTAVHIAATQKNKAHTRRNASAAHAPHHHVPICRELAMPLPPCPPAG